VNLPDKRSSEVVTEDRAGKALRYLATTDGDTADAKVEVARAEYRCKLIRASVILEQTEGSVALKEAKAEVDPRTQAAEADRFKAMGVFEHLKAKRATEEWVMELWRSLNANRRQGNP
jgi:hypothetical protein